MSRVGKLPIVLPEGVHVNFDALDLTVKGPRGQIQRSFSGSIELILQGGALHVFPLSEDKDSRAMWGTARSIINGMVKGVSSGFSEELEVNGVGYRAFVSGSYLNLTLGKSHNTKIEIPSDIKVLTPKQNTVIVEGIDKESLGQFIALIVKQRPPEPYKGKGIKRKGQYIQRKKGKQN